MTANTATMSGPEAFPDQKPKAISDGPNQQPNQEYTSIPSDHEKGFFSPSNLSGISSGYAKGLGRATSAVVGLYTSHREDVSWPQPERRIVSVKNHERLALVTEPDPDSRESSSEVANEVLFPGLSEMDIGSAMLLHRAIAKQHPDRRIITVPTLGVSMSGHTLSVKEGYRRSLEDTAADNLKLLPWLLKDGDTALTGTSLGSYLATLMASQNLSANNESQLNVTNINLVAPAVGARNVPESEKFTQTDAGDEEFIKDVTRRFFRHMPGDTARMAITHPDMLAECASIIAGYAVHPKKLPHRVAAMIGNLRGVQAGIEWSDLKEVARGHSVNVLGGELDPLVQEQLPQWLAVKKFAPQTQIRILEGRGHALTVDSRGAAKHLAEMNEAPLNNQQPVTLAA